MAPSWTTHNSKWPTSQPEVCPSCLQTKFRVTLFSSKMWSYRSVVCRLADGQNIQRHLKTTQICSITEFNTPRSIHFYRWPHRLLEKEQDPSIHRCNAQWNQSHTSRTRIPNELINSASCHPCLFHPSLFSNAVSNFISLGRSLLTIARTHHFLTIRPKLTSATLCYTANSPGGN